MIHKNRGNRRWIDKRKRRSKYNLAKEICNTIKGVLGKYDKGHIYDLNDKLSPSEHEYGYEDHISTSDKKKIESLNEKTRDYEKGYDEMDAMIKADIESWYKDNAESLLGNDDAIAMDKKYGNVPIGKA